MLTAADLSDLARRAATDPRGAFRDLRALDLPRATLWEALLLLTILRVLFIGLAGGGRFVVPFGTTPVEVSALAYTMVLISGFVVMVFLIHYTGRAMGGRGDFRGAMAVTLLVEVLSLALVVIQLVLGLFSLALSGLAGLVALPIVLFCSLAYIDELHGFGSLWKAAGMVVLSIIGLSLGLSLLLTLIGAGVPR